jgi:hypothetical protein
MKALLVLLALGGVAHADPMFAYDHDGTLVVGQAGADALTTAYAEPNAGALQYAWTDAHTLWVLRAQKGVFSIEKIVDGKPDKPRVLVHADWKPEPAGKPASTVPIMYVTQTGEVWLQRCVSIVSVDNHERCPVKYLRVDARAELLDKRPKDVRDDDGLPQPDEDKTYGPQKLAGPKGYMFQVIQNGFSCKGPKHSLPFKGGTRWVERAVWVSSDPPIVRFTVNKFDDFSELPEGQDDGTGEFFLEDCTTFLVDVKLVAPGIVATTEGGGAWKLRRGAQVLGTFTAKHVETAPR